jgi:hypothetical protein
MLLLTGGFVILCGLLLLGTLFVNTDPARLARIVKWTGIVLAVLAATALAASTGIIVFLVPFALVAWFLGGARMVFSQRSGPAAAKHSNVETAFIRMRLDHDTGAMSGTVLQGRFAGSRVEELSLPDLLALLRECRAADEDGARLIEAYLDRSHPTWRDGFRGGTEAPPASATSDVTTDEAYAILGLSPGANDAAIRSAHHELMKKLHPDHGGSDYLATKINRARDVLLHRRR